jgi:hypothetical protein
MVEVEWWSDSGSLYWMLPLVYEFAVFVPVLNAGAWFLLLKSQRSLLDCLFTALFKFSGYYLNSRHYLKY